MSDESRSSTESTNAEKIANALLHLSASLVALKEVVASQGSERRQDHNAFRDTIQQDHMAMLDAVSAISTAIALVHQKLDITREGVTEVNKTANRIHEDTNPRIKIYAPGDGDLVIPAKWRSTLEVVVKKILPWILVGGSFGAMMRDCSSTIFGPSPQIDGGVHQWRQ